MTVVRLWSRFDVVAHVRDLGHVGLIIIYNDDVRGGRGGEDTAMCGSATTEAGLRCPTNADRHVGVRVLPWAKTLVTLLCKLRSRSGLALGPLGAPEYESRVNSRSRVPLPIFFLQI